MSKNEEEQRDSVGEFIYEYILKATDDEDASAKITGMIIDLPLDALVDSIKTYKGL